MNLAAFIALLNNAALLLAVVVIYEASALRLRITSNFLSQAASGGILGLVGIGIMSAPFTLLPGVVFDTRSVLLATSGLFFGPLPTMLAMVMTSVYRIHQGGAATSVGITAIFVSGLIGLFWRFWHQRRCRPIAELKASELYVMGLVVHAALLLLMLLLPWHIALHALIQTSAPILLIFPLATAGLGSWLVSRIQYQNEIKKRAAVDRQLRETHADLTATLQAIPDMLFEVDAEGRHHKVWSGNTDLPEQEKERLLGHTVDEVLPPEAAATVFRALKQADQSGIASGHRICLPLPNGPRWYELSTAKKVNDSEASPRFIILSRDITARVKAEADLHLAASVFSCSQEGIMITDAEHRIMDVNPAFTRITGYCRSEIIGKSSRILWPDVKSPPNREEMLQVLAKAGTWQGEVLRRRKTGEIYAERRSIDAVRDRQGQIQQYVTVFSDISQLKAHQAELDHIAHYDQLTGVPNRRLLFDRLKMAQARASRNETHLAICYLDLDGFKPVNDTYGHPAGDQLLIHVAKHLQDAVREDDTVARLGGDEFVLLLNGLTNRQECFAVLDRLLTRIATPFPTDAARISISASIGVTIYPEDDAGVDTLLRHADQAMYRAKEAGKNSYHLFDTRLDLQAKAKQESLLRIEEGLASAEFRLFYQPKVDMRRGGQVVGAEALIRWQHPELGLQAPNAFLPLTENTDLEITLGEWVISEAFRQVAHWAKTGLILPVSINISSNHLHSPNFVASLCNRLQEYPEIDPEWIGLEILETSSIEDLDHIAKVIDECQALGFDCALDDFGTGYSSLTYLRRLPANIVKIDQSFVRDMLEDRSDLAIVEGVIGLAKAFGRDVIAEGLETLEHGVPLLKLGCHFAQGYGIARPMPADDIPDWIRHWQPAKEWDLA